MHQNFQSLSESFEPTPGPPRDMNPHLKWLKRQTVTLVITGALGSSQSRPWDLPAARRGPGPAQRHGRRGTQPTARPPPGARAQAGQAAEPELCRSPPSFLLILLERGKKKKRRERERGRRSELGLKEVLPLRPPSASHWPGLLMRHAGPRQWRGAILRGGPGPSAEWAVGRYSSPAAARPP